MGVLAIVGAVVVILAGVVGLVKPIRDDVVDVIHSLWIRWRPWRMDLGQEWLNRNLRSELMRDPRNQEIPYVLKNRGPKKAINVTLSRNRGGEFMDSDLGDIEKESESRVFTLLNPQLKRKHYTVTWDDTSSHSQWVRMPKMLMQSRDHDKLRKQDAKRQRRERKEDRR